MPGRQPYITIPLPTLRAFSTTSASFPSSFPPFFHLQFPQMSSWKYSSLAPNPTSPPSRPSPRHPLLIQALKVLSYTLLLGLIISISFLAGRASTSNPNRYARKPSLPASRSPSPLPRSPLPISPDLPPHLQPLLTPPAPPIPLTFTYNGTFASPPSNLTAAVWSSLFPPSGTFFPHPHLSPPQRATLSVYHQLHCLVQLTPLQACFSAYSA